MVVKVPFALKVEMNSAVLRSLALHDRSNFRNEQMLSSFLFANLHFHLLC